MTIDGPAPPSAPVRRPRRLRRLILIVAGFVVLVAALAGGSLLYLYDRATGIDRSTPYVVTRQFLDAALVLKDPGQVSLFTCDGWSTSQAIAEVDAPTDSGVIVSWGDTTAVITGDTATAVVDVRFTIHVGRGLQEEVQRWTLHLENQDGWRVCGLEKQTLLDP